MFTSSEVKLRFLFTWGTSKYLPEFAAVISLVCSNYYLRVRLEVLHSSANNPLLYLARGQGGGGGDSNGKNSQSHPAFQWKSEEAPGVNLSEYDLKALHIACKSLLHPWDARQIAEKLNGAPWHALCLYKAQNLAFPETLHNAVLLTQISFFKFCFLTGSHLNATHPKDNYMLQLFFALQTVEKSC